MPQAAVAEARRPAQAPAAPSHAPVPGDGADRPADDLIAPRSAAGQRVSEADYWRRYYFDPDRHYEWNRGVLEEQPVSDFAAVMLYGWFLHLLTLYLGARPVGVVLPMDMGFRLRLPDGVLIRRPDLSVVRTDNPQPLLWHDRSYHGVYDLCVELLSNQKRADIERDTVQKKAEYAAAGVPEYYILHDDPQYLAFYRRSATGLYVPIEPVDGVIASGVLPGFRFRVTDLLERPPHAGLRDDPVYADFLYPDWQAAEARAVAAAARAEAEQARAEAEAAARRAAEAELAALRATLPPRPGEDG